MGVKVMSRSKGHNAVAAAAYRAGEILDEDIDLIDKDENNKRAGRHDYSRRSGVMGAFILTPKDAPAWTSNRNMLWDRVEKKENRADAQLAREVLVSLPDVDIYNHLNSKNKKKRLQEFYERILKQYVNEHFVKEGMIADVALHEPSKKNDQRHYHAHIMLTMRKIDVANDNDFGAKERGWNSPAKLERWREAWSNHVNSTLKAHSIDAFIDHRTYEERGLDIKATQPLGMGNHRLEMSGVQTSVGNDNRKVKEQNLKQHKYLEKLFERSPMAPLHEILAAIERAGFENIEDVFSSLKDNKTLIPLKASETGEMSELYVFAPMKKRADLVKKEGDKVLERNDFDVDSDIVRKTVKKRGDKTVREALNYTAQPQGFKVIESANNGYKKTYLSSCREMYKNAGYDVIAVARNNRGKEAFKSAGFGKGVLTYKDCLRRFGDRYTGAKSINKKVMIVDEADQLSPLQDHEIFKTAQKIGAKLIFIGNPKAQNKRLWQSLFPYYKLKTAFKRLRTKFFQTQGQVAGEIRDAFANARTLDAIKMQKAKYLHSYGSTGDAKQAILKAWFLKIKKKKDKRFILTAKDKDVEIFNFAVQQERLRRRHLLKHQGRAFSVRYLSDAHNELKRDLFIYWGESIQFKKDYKDLDIEEGARATVRIHRHDHSLIELDDGRVIKLDLRKYNGFDLGYAGRKMSPTTGTELEQGYIYHSQANALDDAPLLYRESQKPVKVFYAQSQAETLEELSSQLLGRQHNMYQGFYAASEDHDGSANATVTEDEEDDIDTQENIDTNQNLMNNSDNTPEG